MVTEIVNGFEIPVLKVNPELNKLSDIPMFEDKIARANEILRTVGMPNFPPQQRRGKGNLEIKSFEEKVAQNTIISIAKKMKINGESIAKIIDYTGLTKEEIENF